MERYDHEAIEPKWQNKWREAGAEKIDKDDTGKEKYYILDMFPYPSGDGLHMGHTESYTSTDILYRYKKMKGFNVLHPQGFDSFGLPAENFAIKTGVHPKETTEKNIANYKRQMHSLGFAYDFEEAAITSSPEYYKWTQWLFTQFLKHDLVYKESSVANWCDSCKTVLANEQVDDGKCDRCKNEVIQKEVPGWFFRITEFADELIEGLEKVDWPSHTKVNQINWIGKSSGAKIPFKIAGSPEMLEVFTTRPDTLFGCTYMVLAPEHDIVTALKDSIDNWAEVEKYIAEVQKKTERDRLESKEKTGVRLLGVNAINPANGEEVPVFIADYVLAGYGTGAIMAVPAHDERDYAFAKKFDLEIIEVISGGDITKEAYVGDGSLVNSGELTGLSVEEAKKKVTELVGGELTNNYRLRDWSMSRQRYWGAPIPVVYDPEGKPHAVPDEHLPWLLPEDVDFVPTGEAPLVNSKELQERTTKLFGEGWTPETDTMDTFVDSAWYFMRYPDPHNDTVFCSDERMKWLPVDMYVGGAEHTYMHLLYARFFTKAMHKIGLIDFDEPFLTLRHQGMVLDKKGVKMSKSKGNVVNPDAMVERFGADATRMYMMFAAPLEDDVMWDENGVVGTYRFLEKVWKLVVAADDAESRIEGTLHKTIKKVGDDIESLKYNTAVSQLMILVNEAAAEGFSKKDAKTLLLLLAPFAPHVTEELWARLGHESSVHEETWPSYEESKLVDETITIAVQVNGKVRGSFQASPDISDEEAITKALAEPSVEKWLENQELKKKIYVKGRLVSLVTG